MILHRKITIATSIAPFNIETQTKCIESWKNQNCSVVSVNSRDEIKSLKKNFPFVSFVESRRDGLKHTGRPLIFLDDIFEALKNSDSGICGIMNSDIFLSGETTISDLLKKNTGNSLIYGSRTDVESIDNPKGEIYSKGFDYFFFEKEIINRIPESSFLIGAPWWDYWLPLAAFLSGYKLLKIENSFFLHKVHEKKWSKKLWIEFGKNMSDQLQNDWNHSDYSDLAKSLCFFPDSIDSCKEELKTKLCIEFANSILDFLDKDQE